MDEPKGGATASDEAVDLADRDVVLVHGESESGYRVIRSRRGTVELGELRNLEEGRPVHGEVVRLSPTDRTDLFDVDVVLEAPTRPGAGPPQVASAAYRSHWEAIFGPRDEPAN